jgi:hypothetical protein
LNKEEFTSQFADLVFMAVLLFVEKIETSCHDSLLLKKLFFDKDIKLLLPNQLIQSCGSCYSVIVFNEIAFSEQKYQLLQQYTD